MRILFSVSVASLFAFVFVQTLDSPIGLASPAELGSTSSKTDLELRRKFALGVLGALQETSSDSATTDPLTDGEWGLVTCQMSVLGLVSSYEDGIVTANEIEAPLSSCLHDAIGEEKLGFALRRWNVSTFEAFVLTDSTVLGYIGIALARYLQHFEGDEELRDALKKIRARLSKALKRPLHQFETYPGVVFPADISVCIAAVAAMGETDLADRATKKFMRAFTHRRTGMLAQTVNARNGRHTSSARSSGTLFSAFFLRGASNEVAEQLWKATRKHAFVQGAGLAAIREYPRGFDGPADVDSGPVVLGLGVSATGFALASAQGDDFRALFRVTNLFGAPIIDNEEATFATGGAIGNALLFALMDRSAI